MNEQDEEEESGGTYSDYCYKCFHYTWHSSNHVCENESEHEDPTTREPSWLDLPVFKTPTTGEPK
jgi:hypothetical protein